MEDVRRRLLARFGPSIDLETNPELVNEIVAEIAREEPFGSINLASYDKTYTEGYNKEDYSRSAYTRYDRTDDGHIWEEGQNALVLPELDRLVVDRLRQQFGLSAG